MTTFTTTQQELDDVGGAIKLLIERYLVEAADLDRADIGVEIELGFRSDLWLDSSPEVLFKEFLAEYGFSVKPDSSVLMRASSLEIFYFGGEVLNDEPLRWSKLKPALAAVLAFLKKEDKVKLKSSSSLELADKKPAFKSRFFRQQQGKVLMLPRAIVPQNFSAGTHLHFDYRWFDSVDHARRFVELFNSFQARLPTYLPPPRYTKERGDHYAKLVNHPAHLLQNRGDNVPSALYFLSQFTPSRYTAVNFKSVFSRGDVEFRFMHATLSLNVIEGWVRTIAELIEFSRHLKDSASAVEFKDYLHKESPEALSFLDRSAARYAAAKDPLDLQRQPTRAIKKLLGKNFNLTPRQLEFILNHEPNNVNVYASILKTILELGKLSPADQKRVKDRLEMFYFPEFH